MNIRLSYSLFSGWTCPECAVSSHAKSTRLCCICATVLPSMKKNKMYNVRIVLLKHTAHVVRALCACPAGLSGCCNHITATLYCVKDCFHLKLNEEDQKGYTEKLQTWNQAREKS